MRKRGFKTHKTHKTHNLLKNNFRPSFVPSALPPRRRLSTLYRNNAPLALAKRLVRLDVSNPVKSPLKKVYNPLVQTLINKNVIKSAICAKRKIRREVLFAMGKGGGNHRPPRYTLESKIRC